MVLCDPGGCEQVHAKEATLGKLAQKPRDLYTCYMCAMRRELAE